MNLGPGALVIVSLTAPREKFWGVLTALSPAGVAVRGIDLGGFDEFLRMLRHEEPACATDVFFPMHRVERIEADAPAAGAPSLAERLERALGRTAADVLG